MEAFKQFMQVLGEYIDEHWIKSVTAAAFMGVGWFFGKRRARAQWRKREFFNRLNVSLNSIQDGRLLIRTIVEKSCSDVFLNSVAVDAIASAARQTTEKDPVLPLPKDDYWYYLNAVLNEVAEKFAEGQMKRDLGLPVTCEQYLMCLTSESAGELRTHKVRAMLVQKKLLEKLPEKQPAFERSHHITRWQTLNTLAGQWKRNPERFLEIDICL